MGLISKEDAIKTVRKTILSLMDGLPTINIDGEKYCADNRLHNAYLEANKAVNNALRELSSWHTEDPTEPNDYLVTMMVGKTEDTVQKRIIIAEWIEPLYDDNGNIAKKGEWVFNPFVYNCKVRQVLAWMPLPDKYEGEV